MTMVRVRYVAQLKAAAGRHEEEVPLDAAPTLHDLLRVLAENHGERVREFLFGRDGEPRASLVIAVGEEHAARGANRALRVGDVVTLLAPMSGG